MPAWLQTSVQSFSSSMFSPQTGSSSCNAESFSSVRLNFSYCAETSGHGRKCSLSPSPDRNPPQLSRRCRACSTNKLPPGRVPQSRRPKLNLYRCGAGVGRGRGVGHGRRGGCVSNEPISMRPLNTRSKLQPRWSVEGGGVKFGSPASIAGLPGSKACVRVGPPISCRGPSNGSVLI